jgi:endonuclease/exonuclease/phosphatase family metal-dependent hydrolase
MDIISWIEHQTTTDIICLQEFPLVHINQFYRALPRGVWGHRFTKSFLLRKKTYGVVTLFSQKKLRILKTKTLLMGVNRMEKSLLGNPMQKSCLVTTFRTKTRTITIANTHLVFLAGNRSRYKQIRMITDHLSAYRHPLMLTGDFNIPSVRAKNKLISYMRTFGFQTITKRISTYRLGVVKYQLDYFFAKRCVITTLTTERIRFSDHYPFTAVVRLSL